MNRQDDDGGVEYLELLRKELDEVRQDCVSRTMFEELVRDLQITEKQIREDMDVNKGATEAAKEAAEAARKVADTSAEKVADVSRKLNQIETEAKKYNLLIRDLKPTAKLERPTDLNKLVKDFITVQLDLANVTFDEAERLTDDTIRVRFPNLREKIRVLSRSRVVKKLNVVEDFSSGVLAHRRRLAAFAQRRARANRRRWALKYDELYFNGRVFVYNEKIGRVVPKRRIT